MQNRQSSLRRLAEAGLIAAMYAALSLVLPLASFGIVQCRLAEALTILAAFTPAAIPGLAVGCFITTLRGSVWASILPGRGICCGGRSPHCWPLGSPGDCSACGLPAAPAIHPAAGYYQRCGGGN